MDEFQFGPKGATGLDEPRPRRTWIRLDGRLVWLLVAALVVAGVSTFVFVTGDDEPAADPASAASPVDRALDSAAKSTIGRAVVVAQTLHAERGSFPSDAAILSAMDPTLTFTAEPSGDPLSVSYAVGEEGFAAAVRSASGTCWWVRVDPSGATSYGSGSTCTGEAAMAASEPAW